MNLLYAVSLMSAISVPSWELANFLKVNGNHDLNCCQHGKFEGVVTVHIFWLLIYADNHHNFIIQQLGSVNIVVTTYIIAWQCHIQPVKVLSGAWCGLMFV